MAARTRFVRCMAAVALLGACAAASAEPLVVVSSGGFAAAYKQLLEQWRQDPAHEVRSQWGASTGQSPNSIPRRLARKEPIDVVIMVGDALDKLIASGQLLPDSKVVLADSIIACAVPKGAAKPDIHTVMGLKAALLAAHSVAWSDSASGEYIQNVLLAKLGVADDVLPKRHRIPGTPVGGVVAKHEADFGCQQLSELLPIPGIDIVGELPGEVQYVTQFSAAIVAPSAHRDEARRFLAFLSSPANAKTISETGLVPKAVRR